MSASASVFVRSNGAANTTIPRSRRAQKKAAYALARGQFRLTSQNQNQQGHQQIPNLTAFGSASLEGRPSNLRRGLALKQDHPEISEDNHSIQGQAAAASHQQVQQQQILNLQDHHLNQSLRRPCALLPRKFWLYIKGGAPMVVSDISIPGQSLLPEHPSVLQRIAERRIPGSQNKKGSANGWNANQKNDIESKTQSLTSNTSLLSLRLPSSSSDSQASAAPALRLVPSPDTPFWRVSRKQRKPKNPITWGGMWEQMDKEADTTNKKIEKMKQELFSSEPITKLTESESSEKRKKLQMGSDSKSESSYSSISKPESCDTVSNHIHDSTGALPNNNKPSTFFENKHPKFSPIDFSHESEDIQSRREIKSQSSIVYDPVDQDQAHKIHSNSDIIFKTESVNDGSTNDLIQNCHSPTDKVGLTESYSNQQPSTASQSQLNSQNLASKKRPAFGSPEYGVLQVKSGEIGVENSQNSGSKQLGQDSMNDNIPGRPTNSGRNLIQKLRESASMYSQTGIHPELVDSLGEALKVGYHAGIEKRQRKQEVEGLTEDSESMLSEKSYSPGKKAFMQLLLSGSNSDNINNSTQSSISNTAPNAPSVSVENMNLLVRSRILHNDIAGAFELHDLMRTHGFEPNADTYASLIVGAGNIDSQSDLSQTLTQQQQVQRRSRGPELARKLYLEMRSQLITPNSKVFGALMKAHTKNGEVGAAQSLLYKIEDEFPELLNVVHYTIVIDGLVCAGETQAAWDCFYGLRTWKGQDNDTSLGTSDSTLSCKPDEVLFTVMIKACALEEKSEKAINMLDDMRTSGLHPTDVTYEQMIKSCACRPDFALKSFMYKNHMDAEDMPISLEGYEALLMAARNIPSVTKAQEILDEMQERGMRPTSRCFEHLVGVFANSQINGGLVVGPNSSNVNDNDPSFFSDHNEWGMQSNYALDPTYRGPRKHKVLPIRERLQNVRHAWLVVHEARNTYGIQVTNGLLNSILQVYVNGEFDGYAVEMLRQYSEFGLKPDFDTYRILLNMFHQQMDTGRFFALWDLCLEQNILMKELDGPRQCSEAEGSDNESNAEIEGNANASEENVGTTLPERIQYDLLTQNSDTENLNAKENNELKNPSDSYSIIDSSKNASLKSQNHINNDIQHNDIISPLSLRRERVSLLFNKALEMAIRTKSSRITCDLLKHMLSTRGHVFPAPQLADRLAKVGRHVLEIHNLISEFILLNKQVTMERVIREQKKLQSDMDEWKLRLAKEGRRPGQMTAWQEGREKNFITLGKRGVFMKQRLSRAEYKKQKMKGGEYYAIKKDRPKMGEELPL